MKKGLSGRFVPHIALALGLLFCFSMPNVWGASFDELFPEDYNRLHFTHNQTSVVDMLHRSLDNPGMESIYTTLGEADLTDAGMYSLLTQMSGSVRFNGIRLSMTSPGLSVLNRSRTIGQWENHIIAKAKQEREQYISDDGSVLLGQAIRHKKHGHFIPRERKAYTEGEVVYSDETGVEYEYGANEEYEELGLGDAMPMNVSCLGKYSKNVWFSPTHSATNVGGTRGTPGFHMSRTGFLMGIERGHCPCGQFGIAFGYTAPYLIQGRDKIEADDIVAGLYFKKKLKNDVYINAWAGYNYQDSSQRRFVTIPDLDQGYKYTGNFNAHAFSATAEISKAIYCRPFLVIRPVAAFDYQRAEQEGFKESGLGPYGLSYGRLTYDTKIARCGFLTQIGASDGSSKMVIRQRIYYARQIGDESYPEGTAYFLDGGTSTRMQLRGADVSRDYMILGAGGQVYLDPTRTCVLFGDYDAIVTKIMTTHAVSLGIIQRF